MNHDAPQHQQQPTPDHDFEADGASFYAPDGDFAAPPPPPDPHRWGHLPPAQRQQAVLAMQRRSGNAAVQRMIGAPTSDIQRAPAVGVGRKHAVKLKALTVPVGAPIGTLPVTLKEIVISGEASVSIFSPEDAKAKTKVSAGASGGRDSGKGISEVGIAAEVERKNAEWKDTALGDVKLTTKGSVKLTSQGFEMKVQPLGLDFEDRGGALEFSVAKVNNKGQITLMSLIPSYYVKPTPDQETTLDSGEIMKVSFKRKVEFVLTPDYKKLALWLAEKMGEAAAAELAIAGGLVVGGIATLAAAFFEASLGSELADRIDTAARNTKDFCEAYAAVMKGGTASPKSEWGKAGASTAQSAISASSILLPEAIYEAAKKRNLSSEAFAIAWPMVKEKAIAAYRKEHWFETWVYDEGKGPGERTLRHVLNDPRWSPSNLDRLD